MKRGFLTFAILISCLGGAEAEAPFAPHRTIADHVITMRDSSVRGTRIVTSGAGWFRVDTVQTQPSATTHYYDHPGSLSLSLSRSPSGGYIALAIARGTPKGSDLAFDHEAYRTNERQVHLGESCTVWNVMRSRGTDAHTHIRKYSCVTDDGLELWYRFVGQMGIVSSAVATKIERRPVPAGEAHPPRDLLDLNAWSIASVPGSASGATPVDFESEMKTIEASPGRNRTTARITRRHHPWFLVEDRLADGGVTLSIENRQTRLSISFESGPGGEYRKLSFARVARDTGQARATPASPKEFEAKVGSASPKEFEAKQKQLQEELQRRAEQLRERLQKQNGRAPDSQTSRFVVVEALVETPRAPIATFPRKPTTPVPFQSSLKETILSETCTWFDMTPGLMDGGFSQCRASDGIALKEDHWSRGGRQVLEAIRLERREVAMDKVLPPADILSAEKWGLPK